MLEAQQARLENPAAVARRKQSRTKFERLDPAKAATVAAEAFHALVEEPSGGPPKLSKGERITGFSRENVAQVALPGGKHELVESIAPMAIRTSAGHLVPVNLSLDDSGAAFEPRTPAVKVRIHKRLGQGAELSSTGVSLTPVNAQGSTLGGSEGTTDGDTVFYANTQTDTDTLAKPTAGGFELSTLLRAVDSPEVLYFRVGMPAGADLVRTRTTGVSVVLAGHVIASVAPPTAEDAAGTSVPVQMRVAGSTLVVSVPHDSGDYQYPIAVDPRAYDYDITTPSTCNYYYGEKSAWEFSATGGAYECYNTGYGIVMGTVEGAGITGNSHEEFRYAAHGLAQVAYVHGEMQGTGNELSKSILKIEFAHGATVEKEARLTNAGESLAKQLIAICDVQVIEEGVEHCRAQNNENLVRIQQTATSSAPAGYGFWFELYNETWVSIWQENGPETSFDTFEQAIAGRPNVLNGSGRWLGEHNGAFEILAKDPGVGVSNLEVFDLTAGPHGEHWEFHDPVAADGLCTGSWCAQTFKTNGAYGTYFTYNPEERDGSNTFEVCAYDQAGMASCSTATVNVDNTPPTVPTVKGIAESGAELTAASHQITAEATDATSGVKSISVAVDGTEIGSPSGSCTTSGCTASRVVSLNGESLSAGEHKLEVTATDNANNISSKKVITFGVREATPIHLGPGSVDPVTGQFSLAATDAAIAGAGRVARSYLSRSLNGGAEGPLGPQWTLNVATGQSLKVLPNGNVELKGAGGESTTFLRKPEGGFTSPPGDANLVLEYKEPQAEFFAIGLKQHREKVAEGAGYMLKNPTAGTTTRFMLPAGSSIWVPSLTEGAAEGDATGYSYRTVEPVQGHPITEPTEILGPVPSGVTCGENPFKVNVETLNAGCRALTFTYAEKTTATGENQSEWGEYNGRLMKVSFTGYNTTGKKVETVAVAQYAYDKQGRLRAEWDPRISPALKTTYGYDAEGHVTALAPAGQEPWAFTYGTISGDSNAGRILKLTRAPASAGLWGGSLPANTEAPKLSGSAITGVKLSASNGTWTNNPVAYAYQWEDCNSSGVQCTPILGATNANYTLASSDIGHSVVAQVSATNGGGTVAAASLPSATVQATIASSSTSYTQTIDAGNSLNAVSCVPGTTDCVVSDGVGKAFYSTNVSASGAATWSTWNGPSGQQGPSQAVACPSTSVCLMATGKETGGGALYYATSLGGSWTQAYSPSYGVDAISCASASFCLDGQDALGYFRYSTSPASTAWPLESQGEAGMKGVFCLSTSFCTMVDSVGHVHIANNTTQIESESWTSTDIDGTTSLDGIACTSTSACLAVDGTGSILNVAVSGTTAGATPHSIDGANNLVAVTCTGSATCATVDSQGNIFVSTNAGASWNKEVALGSTKFTGVSCSSTSLCAAVDTAGRVTTFNPSYAQTIDSGYGLTGVSCVPGTTTCVVSDNGGKALYSTNVSATSPSTWTAWSGPTGQSPSQAVSCPSTSLCLLADGKSATGGNVYYATSLGGSWTTAFEPGYGVLALACASSSFCIDGQGEGGGYVRYSANPGSESWNAEAIAGSANVNGVSCLSSSFCAAVDSAGNVHVATSTAQIESESWINANVDPSTALNGVACASASSCVAVDGLGRVVNITISGNSVTATKQTIDGQYNLTAVTCTSGTTCVAVDNQGNVFVSLNGGENWSKELSLGDKLTSVSCASTSLCVTGDTTGNVTALNPYSSLQEGEPRSPQPGTTIEYRVPVSGEHAPNQMTPSELARWGQKEDLPSEATAVFAPDEPMGWPASDYKRATIDYLDEAGRGVDWATPAGGISTTEYNRVNEVTRKLTADNRATALKAGANSAEVAEALSNRFIYNSEGTQVRETYGPEHKIRLANGTEEETRNRKKYEYNNEAPSGESHNLLTHTSEWSETAGKGIVAKRETSTSYGGQGGLGWKLRVPTRVTSVLEGHETTKTNVYEKETGSVLEASASVSSTAPVFATQFGSAGKGNGQFTGVAGMAATVAGEVLVVDSGNSRVQKFSNEGAYLSAFGTKGAGALQFESPSSIAVNRSTGNIYVTDTANNRVQELSSAGAFIRTWGYGVTDGKTEFETCTASCKAGTSGAGNGQLSAPLGVAIDGSGNVWVVDGGNSRLEEFSAEGSYVKSIGGAGTGTGQFKEPKGVAVSGPDLFVSDYGNNRVEELSLAGSYITSIGVKGSGEEQLNGPYGIAADPVSGALYVSDSLNNRVQELSVAGTFVAKFGTEGAGNGQFKVPLGLAVNREGSVYVGDSGNSRIQEFEPPPATPVFTAKLTSGSEAGPLKEPRATVVSAAGKVYVADTGNSRLEEFSTAGAFVATIGKEGTGNGEFKNPYGIAEDEKEDLFVADTGNNRIQELSSKAKYKIQFGTEGAGAGQMKEPKGVAVNSGGFVFVVDAGNNRIDEFKKTGAFDLAFGYGVSNGKEEFETCTTTCQAGRTGSGNGQFNGPRGIAISANGRVWVADAFNNRIEEFGENGEYIGKFGASGSGNGQLQEPKAITATAAGNLLVTDTANNRIQEFSPSGAFMAVFGDKGTGSAQFEEPWGTAVAPSGAIYVADIRNNRVDEWTPAARAGNEAARNFHRVYYSAKGEAEVAACQNHPEWAGLVCQSEPVAQPEVTGPPALPVTTITYNTWEQPETTTESIGSVTRTKTKKYDSAGREVSSEETSPSSGDKAVPAVTDEYSTETGAITKITSTIEGKTRTITSAYNTLGQLTSYTDAGGSTTKYTYDSDGRPEELSEPKGHQVYSYDPTSGYLTKLVDSAAGTFTASYDAEGHMLTTGYPDGLVAKYAYNSLGQDTSLEYEKTTNCSEKCVWFSDAETLGAYGETTTQTSTLGNESYSYNEAGRLTQTQETPSGKGCVTRSYGYNETSGERESTTTREPKENGECATEGGNVEGHVYDVAGRLLDPGVTYDALGNVTKVPAVDAGGSPITSSFYVDNQVAVQEQKEKSISYTYDPAGRAMINVTKAGATTSTTIPHYAGPGEALTWTCEEAGECKTESESKWTRNIPGIDGALDAIQTNGGTPVLQLHDLQGSIVATAADNETETKLLTTSQPTEFGVPTGGTVPKYGWMGAQGAASELGTGVITEGGMTYVPQLATTIQSEQMVPPGAAPNGAMQTEAYCPPELGWANQSGDEASENTVAEQRALEAETMELVDPHIDLTSRQAEVLAAALRNGPEAILKLASEIHSSHYIVEFTKFIAELVIGVGKELDQGIALGLERCYNSINAGEHTIARCRFKYQWEANKEWHIPPFLYSYETKICFPNIYRKSHSYKYTWPESKCYGPE